MTWSNSCGHDYAPGWNTGSLTMGSSTWGNASCSVTGADRAYVIQASEWGRSAGDQWVHDLENHFAIRTITGNASGAGGENLCFYPPSELTPEQAEEVGRRCREEEYRSDRAGWKGRALLMANLTPRQRTDYEKLGRFTVKTKRGHLYVVGKARCQNVVRLNRRGKPMRTYCVEVGGGVPIEDVMLGQKLMLDHDESHFLKVARQWPVRLALGVGGLVKQDPDSRWTVLTTDVRPVFVNGERLSA